MKYSLIRPCENCPFRSDKLDQAGWLGGYRAEEIITSIFDRQETFSCHKTNDFDDEGRAIETKSSQHCAGALILLEHNDRPNQMMRIMERLGHYDRTKLDMSAPVFDDPLEFIEFMS